MSRHSNLKLKIVSALEDIAISHVSASKSNPTRFSLDMLVHKTEGYRRSISTELQILKRAKILSFESTNRSRGEYILFSKTRKYDQGSVLQMLSKAYHEVQKMAKKPHKRDVSRFLNDSNRSLQEVSTGSEEGIGE